MKRIVDSSLPDFLVFDTEEGDGDVLTRVKNLNDCIAQHVRKIELQRVIMNSNQRMRTALHHAYRSSRRLVKELLARSRAVVEEFFRLEYSGCSVDCAEVSRLNSQSPPRASVPSSVNEYL